MSLSRCEGGERESASVFQGRREGGGGEVGENNPTLCQTRFVPRHFLSLSKSSKSIVDGKKKKRFFEKFALLSFLGGKVSPTFRLIDDAPNADKENESKENKRARAFLIV